MSFNWFDAVLTAVIIVTVILGVIKGFMRQVVGILSVIVGLVLAVKHYAWMSEKVFHFIGDRMLSSFLSFLGIFFATVCVGSLVAWVLSALERGPFRWINRILGLGLGLVKGIFICGVIVFAQLVFPVDRSILRESVLAPYCLRMIKAAYYIIPRDFKQRFRDAYDDILGKGGRDEERI